MNHVNFCFHTLTQISRCDFIIICHSHCLTVVRAPGMDALKVCLGKQCAKADGVSVWEWSGSALDEGDEAAQWFSTYLGKPSRLVCFNAGRA